MPAPKKPTKQPPRKAPAAKKAPAKPKQDKVVIKPVVKRSAFGDYLDNIVAAMLKDRAQRFEDMLFRYLENSVGMYDGVDLKELQKRGEIQIGPNDERKFLWDGEPVVHMPAAHIKYE